MTWPRRPVWVPGVGPSFHEGHPWWALPCSEACSLCDLPIVSPFCLFPGCSLHTIPIFVYWTLDQEVKPSATTSGSLQTPSLLAVLSLLCGNRVISLPALLTALLRSGAQKQFVISLHLGLSSPIFLLSKRQDI